MTDPAQVDVASAVHVGGCNAGCVGETHLLLSDDYSHEEGIVAARTGWCGVEGWHDGSEYICHRLPKHPGKHVDAWEGWTW